VARHAQDAVLLQPHDGTGIAQCIVKGVRIAQEIVRERIELHGRDVEIRGLGVHERSIEPLPSILGPQRRLIESIQGMPAIARSDGALHPTAL
jgi:hypothetical protein